MNIKLNNEVRNSVQLLPKKPISAVKEDRRRTGRYIAILVGILLLILAIYHAWVRKIPLIAGLVVPVLIMFVYIGWVFYTASRDKMKMLDAETALNAARELAACEDHTPDSQKNIEVSIISSKESSKVNSPDSQRKLHEIEPFFKREANLEGSRIVKPIILVNDKAPEDENNTEKNSEHLAASVKFKGYQLGKNRRFCRNKRTAVFKRSYSIA